MTLTTNLRRTLGAKPPKREEVCVTDIFLGNEQRSRCGTTHGRTAGLPGIQLSGPESGICRDVKEFLLDNRTHNVRDAGLMKKMEISA